MRGNDVIGVRLSRGGLLLALAFLVTLPGHASAKRTAWSEATMPSGGGPSAIGGYTAGCVRGAKKLALAGEGYQVMRPARRRYYGHPDLLSVIRDLAKSMQKQKLGPILVGDLAMPMGGPSPRGHASHQSGLDADIWFWHPKIAERRRLTRKETRHLPNHRVVDPKKLEFTKYWSDDVPAMIWAAAKDPRVSRVLVNPMIKKRLCETGRERTALLRKIRPWYGHADHMHVRLHCPTDSKHCVPQDDLPEGDGCGDLDWWLSKKAQRDRKNGKDKYLKTVGAVSPLPEQCQDLIR